MKTKNWQPKLPFFIRRTSSIKHKRGRNLGWRCRMTVGLINTFFPLQLFWNKNISGKSGQFILSKVLSLIWNVKIKVKKEDFSVIVWFFETGYNSSHRILVQRYSAKYLFPLQKNVGLRFFINGKVFHTWSKHQLFIHLLHFIFYISGKPCSDSWIWMHILDQHFSTSWLFIYLMLNKVTLTKCE